MVSDNPAQVKRLEEIESLQKQWLIKAGNREIEIRRKVDGSDEVAMSGVVKLIEAESGKKLIDNIRLITAKFTQEEQELMST